VHRKKTKEKNKTYYVLDDSGLRSNRIAYVLYFCSVLVLLGLVVEVSAPSGDLQAAFFGMEISASSVLVFLHFI